MQTLLALFQRRVRTRAGVVVAVTVVERDVVVRELLADVPQDPVDLERTLGQIVRGGRGAERCEVAADHLGDGTAVVVAATGAETQRVAREVGADRADGAEHLLCGHLLERRVERVGRARGGGRRGR